MKNIRYKDSEHINYLIKVGVVVGVLYYGQTNQGWLVVALCIVVISLYIDYMIIIKIGFVVYVQFYR